MLSSDALEVSLQTSELLNEIPPEGSSSVEEALLIPNWGFFLDTQPQTLEEQLCTH